MEGEIRSAHLVMVAFDRLLFYSKQSVVFQQSIEAGFQGPDIVFWGHQSDCAPKMDIIRAVSSQTVSEQRVKTSGRREETDVAKAFQN